MRSSNPHDMLPYLIQS
uniref:Uncharacterized protein n=1 Tax=Anguilla anguilla TaxID=7936 RepID=A0A0E9SGD9_ANGAN